MLHKFLFGLLTFSFAANLIAGDFYTKEIGGRENGKIRHFIDISKSSDPSWVREYSLISMGRKGLEVFPYSLNIDCRLKTLTYGQKVESNDLMSAREGRTQVIESFKQEQINSIIGPACNS